MAQGLARVSLSRLIQEHPEHLLKEFGGLPYPLVVSALKAMPEVLEGIERWAADQGLTQLSFLAEGNRSLVCRFGKGEVLRIALYNDTPDVDTFRRRTQFVQDKILKLPEWKEEWKAYEAEQHFRHTRIPSDFPFQIPPLTAYRHVDDAFGMVEVAVYPELQTDAVNMSHRAVLRKMMDMHGWSYDKDEVLRNDQMALLPDFTPVLIDGLVWPREGWVKPEQPLPLLDLASGYDWSEWHIAQFYPHVRQGTVVTYQDGHRTLEKHGVEQPLPEVSVAPRTELPVDAKTRKGALGINSFLQLFTSKNRDEADKQIATLAEKLEHSVVPGADKLAELVRQGLEEKHALPLFPDKFER